jgi:chorismate mutase
VPRRSRGKFIDEDTPEAILAGTRELLAAIAQANGIATEDIASAFVTSTADLRSAFPARAARDLGWTDVPLLGVTEVDKPGAPPRCIRVLLHWNTSCRHDEIVHVYLRGSNVMRAQDPPSPIAAEPQPKGFTDWRPACSHRSNPPSSTLTPEQRHESLFGEVQRPGPRRPQRL